MITDVITQQLAASILAVATTIHLSMLLLRLHRATQTSQNITLLFPSVVFSTTPWLFPNWTGLAIGFGLHGLWFFACENLIQTPLAATAGTQSQSPIPRPKASGHPTPKSSPPLSPKPETSATPDIVPVPVIAVFKETEEITTFRFARPEGFDFKAGQFVSVRVNIDGKPVTRCYSISSGPEAKGYLEISVKKQGLMSGTLHATIRPGSMLSIRKPAGVFVFPEGDDRPVTLLAGGIGITPLMSMLRHSLSSAPYRPITLIYSVNWQKEVVFAEELRWIEKRHPQVKIVVATTHGPHSPDYQSGRIDRNMLVNHVQDLTNNIFLLCGPPPMISAMQSELADLGVHESQIRFEVFEAAIAASQQELVPVEAKTPFESAANGTTIGSGPYHLKLTNSNHTISADADQTLLESCEEAGVEIPSICRAGVCGTCRTRVVGGQVRCDSHALDDSDRSKGFVLACVAWPEGDCAIEA